MKNNKLTKKDLQTLVNIYEQQIDILDLILSDMSDISLNIVQKWLDDTYKELDKATKQESKNYNGTQLSFLDKQFEKGAI